MVMVSSPTRTSLTNSRTIRWRSMTLRDHARIRLQLRLDRVVPFGQSFMGLQSKCGDLIGRRFEAAGIIPAIEISGDPQSGLSLCGAGIVEDLLVGIQGLTGPIAGDFGKKAMLDRVPFGSAH